MLFENKYLEYLILNTVFELVTIFNSVVNDWFHEFQSRFKNIHTRFYQWYFLLILWLHIKTIWYVNLYNTVSMLNKFMLLTNSFFKFTILKQFCEHLGEHGGPYNPIVNHMVNHTQFWWVISLHYANCSHPLDIMDWEGV